MAVVAASPLVAIGSAVAGRAVGLATLVPLPVLVMVMVRRRWFCRWLCPVGLVCELAGRLGWAAGRRAPRIGPVGHWFALVTLGGACLGYPALLWMDPLALLASFLGACWTGFDLIATSAAMAGLVIILLLCLFAPGLWCARICPLGGTQELLAAAAHGACRKADSSDEPGWRLGRRIVLAGGLGAACAMLARRSADGPSRPIRPPGAVDETRFCGVCLRCGNCVRTCPTGILHPDLGSHGGTVPIFVAGGHKNGTVPFGRPGFLGLLAPLVRFDAGYCLEDCCRCGEVCPSGAIRRIGVSEKKTARMGLARVDMGLCLLSEGRECNICKNCCPYDAIRTPFSEEEYTTVVTIDRERCPGCGACEAACPTSPRKAIVVQCSTP
jgi:NAD-dependent dihydropyrimidine dehydrogenase PreA subunit